MPARILVIDDDIRNLKLIETYLEDEGYELVTATDGEAGWSALTDAQCNFDLILLDRMMPNLDGIGFLKRFNKASLPKRIPVIMQTAASEPGQIREGLELGVFYYLTKPYDDEVLISLVAAAIADNDRTQQLYAAMEEREKTFALVQEMRLELRSIDEARHVAATVAHFFPEPGRVITGISELLINAVEHGNLELSYDDKTHLLTSGQLVEEIERRQSLPEYADRRVELYLLRDGDQLKLRISDEGPGFDWSGYLEFNADRASDPHGRGIAMAKMLSFDELHYEGRGNIVQCSVNLNPDDRSA